MPNKNKKPKTIFNGEEKTAKIGYGLCAIVFACAAVWIGAYHAIEVGIVIIAMIFSYVIGSIIWYFLPNGE